MDKEYRTKFLRNAFKHSSPQHTRPYKIIPFKNSRNEKKYEYEQIFMYHYGHN